MSSYPHYTKGDWEALCDSCGRKFKASELRKRWDGLMVDSLCWEPRHPQDFVRAKVDIQAPVWTRPEPSDTFVPMSYGIVPVLLDNVPIIEGQHAGDRYIDSTYFLADFLINGQYIREFSFVFGKGLVDSTTNSSAGTLTIEPYIDPTYFLADYIRTVTGVF